MRLEDDKEAVGGGDDAVRGIWLPIRQGRQETSRLGRFGFTAMTRDQRLTIGKRKGLGRRRGG